MKLITLNTWDAKIFEPLMDFFQRNQDIDIFCLQEVWDGDEAVFFREGKRMNQFSEIAKMLPNHKGFFAVTEDLDDIPERGLAVPYGLATFVKKDIEILSHQYMAQVATKLQNLATYFPGHTFDNSNNFIEKLQFANNHRKNIVKTKKPTNIPGPSQSPVASGDTELRVVDSLGNITGVVNGVNINNIPSSVYDPDKDEAMVIDANDTYTYKIYGENGTSNYDLNLQNTDTTSSNVFQATSIPINDGEIHTYHIDEAVLAQGGNGVTLEEDTNGDGIPEQTITTGSVLDLGLPTIDTNLIPSECELGYKIDLSEIVSDDFSPYESMLVDVKIDGNPVPIILEKYVRCLNLNIGDHVLTLHVTDEAGNVADVTENIKIIYVYEHKLPIENDTIAIGNKLKVQFLLKSSSLNPVGSSKIPIAHPVITLTRLSDNFIHLFNCNNTQSCFTKVNNKYTFVRQASILGVGDWEAKVLLDDGKEYITHFTIN